MTAEQEAQIASIAAVRHYLRAAMATVPREVLDGGVVRVAAFKRAVAEAKALLERFPLDTESYAAAYRAIQASATDDIEALAKAMYEEHDERTSTPQLA